MPLAQMHLCVSPCLVPSGEELRLQMEGHLESTSFLIFTDMSLVYTIAGYLTMDA